MDSTLFKIIEHIKDKTNDGVIINGFIVRMIISCV